MVTAMYYAGSIKISGKDKTADVSGERELVDSFCNIIFASSGYVA